LIAIFALIESDCAANTFQGEIFNMKNVAFVICLLGVFLVCPIGGAYADPVEEMKGITARCKATSDDKAEFYTCLERECEAGSPDMAYALAVMYYKGKGVSKDINKAISWLELAAKKGHKESKVELFRIYLQKNGEYYDCQKGIKWLESAVSDGNDEARIHLGKMYLYNRCGLEDYGKAFGLLMPAAENGDAYAQLLVGMMYIDGFGVDRSLPKAKEWIGKAKLHGDEKVKNLARKIEKRNYDLGD